MGSSIEQLVARLARTFVVRHFRPSEFGIEDVEAHWRDLPEVDRQAFLDAMHAPARPELQGDLPETRQLKDLPPGLQAVYKAVQQDVGLRKAELLRAKVGPDTRSAGYLHQMVSPDRTKPRPPREFAPDEKTDWEGADTETLRTVRVHMQDLVREVYPEGADWNGPFRRAWVKRKKEDRDTLERLEEELRRRGEVMERVEPRDVGAVEQPSPPPPPPGPPDEEAALGDDPDWDTKAQGVLDELRGADLLPDDIIDQAGGLTPVQTLDELIGQDFVEEETLLDNGLLTSEQLTFIYKYAQARNRMEAKFPGPGPSIRDLTRKLGPPHAPA